jgi:nicotinate-nucleotide pyrophosphorylase (carboxylating)
LVKDTGIIAGVDFAKKVFNYIDPGLNLEILINDGEEVKKGDIVFFLEGSSNQYLRQKDLFLMECSA